MCLGLTHARRIVVVMASVSGVSACATKASRASTALYAAINSQFPCFTRENCARDHCASHPITTWKLNIGHELPTSGVLVQLLRPLARL